MEERRQARALWASGRTLEAIERLRPVVAQDPMDCTLRITLARWYLEVEDHLSAQRLLAPLLRLDADSAELQRLWEQVNVSPRDRYRRKLDRTYHRP